MQDRNHSESRDSTKVNVQCSNIILLDCDHVVLQGVGGILIVICTLSLIHSEFWLSHFIIQYVKDQNFFHEHHAQLI